MYNIREVNKYYELDRVFSVIFGEPGQLFISKKSLNAHQKAEVEVTEYLRAKKIPIECDPYGFWTGDNTVKWPILSKIATRFLSAPCTSAEAERLFSSAGLIINNLRKSLLQENAEMLLFLHHNLEIYNFEYE
uniref:HAT C-terminal dimerisation domain-containing protein n=1 Tax=Meloidogyne incognita TaxID=6306 RepID=A0A914LA81_MELIC